jgi:hypothetical protein
MNPDLNELAQQAAETARSKGFYTPADLTTVVDEEGFGVRITNADLMLGKLMLVVTEVEEWYHALNTNRNPNEPMLELADIAIRILAIFGEMRIEAEYLVTVNVPMRVLRIEEKAYALLVGKLSGAAQAVRTGDVTEFKEYLQEALGICFAIASSEQENLFEYILYKMEQNRSRPAKHGKVTVL